MSRVQCWVVKPDEPDCLSWREGGLRGEHVAPNIAPDIQWQFASLQTNWMNIPGATNFTLVIDPVSQADEGAYRATSSWMCGSGGSPATLTVLDPPRFDSFAVAPSDGSFSFTISSEPGLAFRLDTSTNLVDWVEFVTVTNTAGRLVLSDPDAPNFGHRFYRAVVTSP